MATTQPSDNPRAVRARALRKARGPEYSAWLRVRRMPHAREWDTFDGFMADPPLGTRSDGMVLTRENESEPHGPFNSRWVERSDVMLYNRFADEDRRSPSRPDHPLHALWVSWRSVKVRGLDEARWASFDGFVEHPPLGIRTEVDRHVVRVDPKLPWVRENTRWGSAADARRHLPSTASSRQVLIEDCIVATGDMIDGDGWFRASDRAGTPYCVRRLVREYTADPASFAGVIEMRRGHKNATEWRWRGSASPTLQLTPIDTSEPTIGREIYRDADGVKIGLHVAGTFESIDLEAL